MLIILHLFSGSRSANTMSSILAKNAHSEAKLSLAQTSLYFMNSVRQQRVLEADVSACSRP